MENTLVGSIQITPQEVKDYFKDAPLPQLEAEVEAAQVLIIPSQNTALKYQYGSTPNNEQAKIFLDSLRQEIQLGNIPFEEVARNYSNDPFTAPQGGYLLNAIGEQKLFMSELDGFVYFVVDTLKVGTVSPVLNYRSDQGEEGCRMIFLKK